MTLKFSTLHSSQSDALDLEWALPLYSSDPAAALGKLREASEWTDLSETYPEYLERKGVDAERYFGPKVDAYRETENELALRSALEPYELHHVSKYGEARIKGYIGWSNDELAVDLVSAMDAAVPMPTTLGGAWAELCKWRELCALRLRYDEFYEFELYVMCRLAALKGMMVVGECHCDEDRLAKLQWELDLATEEVAKLRSQLDYIIGSDF